MEIMMTGGVALPPMPCVPPRQADTSTHKARRPRRITREDNTRFGRVDSGRYNRRTHVTNARRASGRMADLRLRNRGDFQPVAACGSVVVDVLSPTTTARPAVARARVHGCVGARAVSLRTNAPQTRAGSRRHRRGRAARAQSVIFHRAVSREDRDRVLRVSGSVRSDDRQLRARRFLRRFLDARGARSRARARRRGAYQQSRSVDHAEPARGELTNHYGPLLTRGQHIFIALAGPLSGIILGGAAYGLSHAIGACELLA